MSERGLRIGPADFAFGLCESLDLGDLQPFRDETWDHCRPLPPIFGEGSLRSLAPIDGLSLIVARHGPCDEKVSVNAESPGLLKLMYPCRELSDARQTGWRRSLVSRVARRSIHALPIGAPRT